MNEAIVRDVNCVGPYQGDLAQNFCQQYPDNELFYQHQFDLGNVEPATVLVFDRGGAKSPRWIFNLPTRIHWNGDIDPGVLADGIQAVFDDTIKYSIDVLRIQKFENSNISWEEIKIQFLMSFSRIPDIELDFIESIQPPKEVTIFTDGGVSNGTGGYGVVIRFGEFCKELSSGYTNTTVGRMELMAAIIGLESLTEPCKVRLYSDSRYVIDSVTKGTLFRWLEGSKSKKGIQNLDLWQRFFDVYIQHQVKMLWVKGHAEVADNERCDELASEARKLDNLPPDLMVSSRQLSKVKPKKTSAKKTAAKKKPRKHGDPCPNCRKPLQKRNGITENPNSKHYYPWHLFCADGCERQYHVRSARVLKKPTEK